MIKTSVLIRCIGYGNFTNRVYFTEKWSYVQWEKKIQSAFEKKFWISKEPNLNIEGEETNIIHKRGIYKDCYKATNRFTDYQFRPNFPMAMAVVGDFH